MGKRRIRILPLILCLVLTTNTYIDAVGTSIIYDILNCKNESNKASIIYDIMNKGSQEIELVNQHSLLDVNGSDEKAYLRGVDISKWNGEVDWKSLKKAGIKFVIIRAGYGSDDMSDNRFQQNIEGAIEHGLSIGIYWFSYALSTQDARREAVACINSIKKYKKHINLPVFYDYEYDSVDYSTNNGVRVSKQSVSNLANTFCKYVEQSGYPAGIYTNIDYASKYFTKDVLSNYHTWIAQWGNSVTYKGNYIMWQKSDSYYVNGSRFDLNHFYYNRYRAWRK